MIPDETRRDQTRQKCAEDMDGALRPGQVGKTLVEPVNKLVYMFQLRYEDHHPAPLALDTASLLHTSITSRLDGCAWT